MTLGEFRLAEVADGTELTVIESGFDQIPPRRRDQAFRRNDEGWAMQIQNLRWELKPDRLDEARRALDQISHQRDEALARLKLFVEESAPPGAEE
jgi:hypothetical protein